MNDVFTLDKEFLFKSDIYEICSISVENNYDINNSVIVGEFLISGSYRLHEISINREDFLFKIPIKLELNSNINLDSVKLEITDFTYEFNNRDELSVHLEYLVSADEAVKVFDDEEKLEEFLSDNSYEVVDLRDEVKDSDMVVNDVVMPEVNEDVIINSINGDDEYILYHIHTVGINDSLEGILKKYNISLDVLKEYNSFDNLELNMKLIIPYEDL